MLSSIKTNLDYESKDNLTKVSKAILEIQKWDKVRLTYKDQGNIEIN